MAAKHSVCKQKNRSTKIMLRTHMKLYRNQPKICQIAPTLAMRARTFRGAELMIALMTRSPM